ncbi:DUF6691 family protein [Rhodobium gokarnense]|uniref:Membrane protein YedE/YeeE n=1 Tax=Rhodobium gokarnense TaxID=364296 RepID=A0ABT3HHH0_9HYPH|nr:DUF6691 family protein [Rhodobium gokarnense]MCW2309794.1 putative membrane protein YedE/YeeE [Rhodobium gokarnense]
MTLRDVGEQAAMLLTGVLYGAGFVFAGLADPANVRAMLGFSGLGTDGWHAWPVFSLFVALIVAMWGIRMGQRLRRPVLARSFSRIIYDEMDLRALIGAVLLGTGWGIAGFVPSTALAALTSVPFDAGLFLFGAIVGIVGVDLVARRGNEPQKRL